MKTFKFSNFPLYPEAELGGILLINDQLYAYSKNKYF